MKKKCKIMLEELFETISKALKSQEVRYTDDMVTKEAEGSQEEDEEAIDGKGTRTSLGKITLYS